MRRTTTLLVGLALLTLAACNETTDPPPSSPTPTATTTSTTPTPTASTPPVMPQTAKAHTKAGAKAFVEYFWEVIDYASVALDGAIVQDLTADGCSGCRGPIELINALAAEGGRFYGADTRLSEFRAVRLTPGGQPRMEVTFNVATPAQRVDFPGSDRDEEHQAGVRRTRFLLKPIASGGWRVVLWEPL